MNWILGIIQKMYSFFWGVWFEYHNAKIEAEKKGNIAIRRCFMCNKRMLLFKNDIPSDENIKLVCSDKCTEDFNTLCNKQFEPQKN